ncbi:uncharacterized protein PAC_15950 [Phialocephala subalpina]|uniref:DUF676 domain-containing protein n=1 Tax=Phialocephala subalpina TaxID=576137 RepID=A0A1L7XLZ0_9HELO|nr:uncharacterized protein PAC_15950 [Phialocephala subalpina]
MVSYLTHSKEVPCETSNNGIVFPTSGSTEYELAEADRLPAECNARNNDDHADNTWTDKKSGKNWLRDFLPSEIPYARILAFQYNANVVFGASSAGVEEQAINILHLLQLERKFISARPIIFIAHSLGGIIVKQALVTAYRGDGTYVMISNSTYGIAFFGVPHHGTKYATWGRIAARIVGVSGQINESFLNSIELGSAYNDILSIRFEPLLNRYRFITICETLPEEVNGINLGIIVDKTSAVLELDDSQEGKLFLNRTHKTICKFASNLEPEWKQVLCMLCYGAESAIKSSNHSPMILKRKEMFKDLSWRLEETSEQSLSSKQAIQRAQEVLKNIKEDSEENAHLHEVQQQVDHLNSGVMVLVGWLFSILTPILFAVPILIPLSYMLAFLPRKATVIDKANEVQKSQQDIVQLERLTLERLDDQRSLALEAINMLQIASNSESSQDEDSTDAYNFVLIHRLQQTLDQQTERIAREMHKRQRVYVKAEAYLKQLEEGQREAEGIDEREFYPWVAAKVREDREKQLARQLGNPVEEVEDDSCC